MARPPSDEAFTEFVAASWPSLYRTAYLLLGDRGLAEDLVQTALAKTYASWGKVRDVGAARGYARTTLVNTAASWFASGVGGPSARPRRSRAGRTTRTPPFVRPWLRPSRDSRRGSGRSSCCASTRTCRSPRPPARS